MSEVFEFPKSIEGFGYKFNEKGELRNIETNERFLFHVKPQDRFYNQEHYEALGEVIGEYIENELVDKYNLVRQIIPVESKDDDDVAKSRIYQSDDAQECQTLLLLIQGSGVVRPGQWARQVVINDSLELGTMFPYIRKAQELKWGIIIFNPNENYQSIMKDGEVVYRRISGSESPQDHCLYVWDKFVKNAKAEKILIVAHSYGGICTTYMLDSFDEFKSRVKGIALTDSVHSSGMIPAHSRKWFRENTINWIKSPLPLNEHVPEAKQYYGCLCFSAGHPKHEYTSGMAIEIVFEYLQGRAEKKNRKEVTNKESETDEQSSAANSEDTTVTKTRIDSPMEVVDEPSKAAIDAHSQETGNLLPLEKDTTVTENSQLDSIMKIADESPINAQTQETSSVPFEDSSTETMEIVDESSKEALDSAMEVVDESSKAALDLAMEVVDESSKAALDSAMEVVDESSKAALDSAMEVVDESSKTALDSAMEVVDESSEAAAMEELPQNDEKDTTGKLQLIAETANGTEPEITGQQEPFDESQKEKVIVNNNILVENNTSENQVVITEGVPKETETYSTSIQQIKDDNIPKESSQDNNKADNLSASDHLNNFKENEEI